MSNDTANKPSNVEEVVSAIGDPYIDKALNHHEAHEEARGLRDGSLKALDTGRFHTNSFRHTLSKSYSDFD